MPIIITVEGANIMTRNLLIFGQGAMACHPYVRKELAALVAKDRKTFSKILLKHIKYTLSSLGLAIIARWTGGVFIKVPDKSIKRTMQRLTVLSRLFATIADLALIVLGDKLKRKERLSARLADALSYLYMAMAAIHRYQLSDASKDHVLHLKWATQYCYFKAELALWYFLSQFPNKFISFPLRLLLFPLGCRFHHPSDKLCQNLAENMAQDNAYRQQIKEKVHLTNDATQPVERVEQTFQQLINHQELYQKIKSWHKKFNHLSESSIEEAFKNKEITAKERDILVKLEKMRWDAVQVDAFSNKNLML